MEDLQIHKIFIAFFLLGAIFGVALDQTIILVKQKIRRNRE